MKGGAEAKVVQREQEQAGTIPGSQNTRREGEHGGVRLLNALNKQPALQVARLSLGAESAKTLSSSTFPSAHPGLGVGPGKRWQHLLLFVVIFTRWSFAGRRGCSMKPAVAAAARRVLAKLP